MRCHFDGNPSKVSKGFNAHHSKGWHCVSLFRQQYCGFRPHQLCIWDEVEASQENIDRASPWYSQVWGGLE